MSSKTPPRRWPRWVAISWDELRTRGAQEIAKRWDVTLYRLGVRSQGEGLKSLPLAPARFFFGPGDLPLLADLVRERLPREGEQMIERAERICRHRLDLLGYQDLDYGPEIDWHLDAVHGKRAPRKPGFQIRVFNFDEVGDAKVIWELNRHQHLVALAKAYCLTQEERFPVELLRQWYHWQRENPYPIGINWVSSLEVAFRSLSWLWVRHLLAGCSAVPERFQFDLRQALALHGRHIARYLSTFSSPNTHLLGEAVGLFFIGTLCPELPWARLWQQRGWEIVLGHAERQVQADGMYFEQSVYYHVYALDLFLHARTLAACHQISIPAAFDGKVEKMLELLQALGQAGTPPRLGDDDGGRVFNPQRNRAEHLLDPLATGAVVFGRADFKTAARGLREETLWLLGPKGAAQFEEIASASPRLESTRFAMSGLHVLAHAEPVPRQLVIDCGPQGPGRAGHSHADALSLELAVDGREWLVDPGTLSYVASDRQRDLFRGTAAHNTLQVDGLNQAELAGPFAWRSLPEVHIESWAAGATFDFFAGSHTGYCRLPGPVQHRRWVFHLKSRFWLVRDLAQGQGVHQLDLFWHLASNLVSRNAGTKIVFLRCAEQRGLAFLPVEGHGWSQEVRQGAVSPVYGKQEMSPVLRFSKKALLPAEFAILLLPVGQVFEELGVLAKIHDAATQASVHGYRYHAPGESHYIFFAERGQRWHLGPWASDAQFLYCRLASEGVQQHWVMCEGSTIEIAGQQAVAFEHPVARFEWESTGAIRHTFSSDESALSHLSEEALASAPILPGSDG